MTAKNEAIELQRFKDWIVARGAELLAPTNPYEIVRYRNNGATAIIYENKKGRRSFTGGSESAWAAFKEGKDFRFAKRTTSQGGRKRAVIVRTLIERDGARCFYCMDPFSDELPPTKEHLVARTAGGPDHIANLFLSCGPCNCEVGHRSAAEKIKFRDLKRRGAGTLLLTDIRRLIEALNIIEHIPLFAPILKRIDAIIHSKPQPETTNGNDR